MSQIRNSLVIQGVNAFTQGSLEVLLPLLLVERNIRIEHIGIIFALGPLIFQLSRMVFGVFSDFFGRKKFYIINGLLSPITHLIYALSNSPLIYAFGKVSESLRDASLWAVNRAFLLEQDEHKNKNLVHMRTVDNITQALGRFIVGILIAYIFFFNTLLFLTFISILILPYAFMLKDKQKKHFNFSRAWKILNIKNKSRDFKKFLLFFSLCGFSNGIIFSGYVFPLFLNSKNFSPEIIGLLLGLQLFIAGVFGYFMKKVRLRSLLLIGGILYTIFVLLLDFAGYTMLTLITSLLLGITSGIIYISNEFVFSQITRRESYASDIALLAIGYQVGRSISQVLSGYTIPSFGFISVFSISIFAFAVYTIGTYRIFK